MSNKAHPLGEILFRKIIDSIYSGELELGSEVNEVILAERFGVSRGPVREALRRLQGIGLVSREPYFRARVISLRVDEVVELFQMREALEGMACRLAAMRMTPGQIASLAADLEAQRKAVLPGGCGDDVRAFDFHERIVQGAKNARIMNALCGDLYQLLRLYRRRSGEAIQRKVEAHLEHWQILQAIKAGDPTLAESLMRSHVARASENIVRALVATDNNFDIAPAESRRRRAT